MANELYTRKDLLPRKVFAHTWAHRYCYEVDCVYWDYESAMRFFETCKSPAKGKPISVSGRMYLGEDRETIEVWRGYGFGKHGKAHARKIAEVTPDNVLTFTVSPEEAGSDMQSLVMVSSKITPLTIRRKSKGVYTVASPANLAKQYDEFVKTAPQKYSNTQIKSGFGYGFAFQFAKDRAKQSPELFNGLKFQLPSGGALNAKPSIAEQRKQTLDKDKRKVWLRKVKQFNKLVKTYTKLTNGHAVYEYAKKHGLEPGITFGDLQKHTIAPADIPFNHLDIVEEALRNGVLTPEYIDLLCRVRLYDSRYQFTYRGIPSYQKAGEDRKLENIHKRIMRHCSDALRVRMGVFKL